MAKIYILVDSDILIDVSRGILNAVQILQELEQNHILAISVIAQLELMVGCRNKNEFNHLKRFLERFKVIHLSEAVSSKAVRLFEEYRLSHGVLIADMLIASTAIIYDIPLISKNQKDYIFIKELELLKY